MPIGPRACGVCRKCVDLDDAVTGWQSMPIGPRRAGVCRVACVATIKKPAQNPKTKKHVMRVNENKIVCNPRTLESIHVIQISIHNSSAAKICRSTTYVVDEHEDVDERDDRVTADTPSRTSTTSLSTHRHALERTHSTQTLLSHMRLSCAPILRRPRTPRTAYTCTSPSSTRHADLPTSYTGRHSGCCTSLSQHPRASELLMRLRGAHVVPPHAALARRLHSRHDCAWRVLEATGI